MGTPVVVSDVCAGREEIEDGVSGLWFKSADVDALARALERLKDDRLVADMSKAVYEDYWRNPPTLDAHVTGLLAIYQGMLDGRRLARSTPTLAMNAGSPRTNAGKVNVSPAPPAPAATRDHEVSALTTGD